jgi:predicted CoA-binding protein
MDPLDRLRALLAESTDPFNPSAERIEALFRRLHSLAVVGLSRDPVKAARRVPSYLAAKGYEVIPVNPHAERILGRPARATLAEVEEPVDMVVIFRPSRQAGPFVEQAAARPEAPAIWLQEGIRADEQAAAAREAGLLVVQDLCTYKVHRALFT